MNYLMVDISGKVPNYDIALCEALSKRFASKGHVKLLSANINPSKIECDSRCLISLVPKSLQNSENLLKRSVKALEGFLNYFYLILILLFRKYDFVHFQWLPFLEISSVERFFLRMIRLVSPRSKLFLTVHNIYPHNCSKQKEILYRKRFAKVEGFFDKFILHLQTSKNEFCSAFGVNPAKCTVLHHGVFVPKQLEIPSRIAGEKFNLIMYGNQSYYKGTDILVDALLKLPKAIQNRVHTLIVGKIPLDYLSDLQRKTKNLNVDWVPEFVSDDYLNAQIIKSDAVVLPYRQISQSGVLLLALNFERLVLASDLPSFTETLKSVSDNLLFESENAASLATLIEKVSSDAFDYDDCVKKLKKLKDTYSWSNVAADYVSLVGL